jgi:hypothetical protein
MKKIVKYVATDGAEFNFRSDCLVHDQNCLLAWKVMAKLAVRPDGGEFEAGTGYIQHDLNKVETVRDLFLGFCVRYSDRIGRLLGETLSPSILAPHANNLLKGHLPDSIFKHWERFECIDTLGREWALSYYVKYPPKYVDSATRLN